jgi:hypothetical protein
MNFPGVTDALQKLQDASGKSPMSFFSLQESRPGHGRAGDDSLSATTLSTENEKCVKCTDGRCHRDELQL